MPIYEYQCGECGHRLEAIQKFSDKALTDCPACEKPSLSKLVSAPSFRLKGGGWYETDFKTGAKRHGTQDSESSSGASADTKKSPAKEKTAGSAPVSA